MKSRDPMAPSVTEPAVRSPMLDAQVSSALDTGACRVCGGRRLHDAGVVETYGFLECDDCGFVFAPAIRASEMEALYAAGYHGPEDGGPATGWADPAFLAPGFAHLGPDRLSILDFGCGESLVPDLLREAGHRVVAVDLAPTLRPHPDRLRGRLADLGLPEHGFDLVYAFQVFEHLPDPKPILDRLLRLVGPGGLLLIHTDMEVPERTQGAEAWWYVTPPDHCAFFRHRTFERLLDGTGHRIVWRDPKSVLIRAAGARRSERPPDLGTALVETAGLRVKAARHGLVAYPVHDTFVGRSIDLYGEWSPDDARVLDALVRPGMTALDIGANIGTHTLCLAHAVGPGGHVVAFEPVRALFEILCRNLALNDIANVEARPLAVGRARGTAFAPALDLARTGNLGAAALTGDGDAVAVTAVDDLDLTRCDLIKADVEGMESEVIAGAMRTLRRFRPLLFVENEDPERSPDLIARLQALGYKLFWHAPRLFRPDNFFGNPVDVFPRLGSLNLVGIPEGRETHLMGLPAVSGPHDWPAWWPDWSRQGAETCGSDASAWPRHIATIWPCRDEGSGPVCGSARADDDMSAPT